MWFECEQPFLSGERCVTSRKTAAKETIKNRARKVLPKSSQGIAETSLVVEETLEGVWERSLCTRFLSGRGEL